jgi:hypothetical protein
MGWNGEKSKIFLKIRKWNSIVFGIKQHCDIKINFCANIWPTVY